MKREYIGCEHSSELYLKVAREMKEERERMIRKLKGQPNLSDIVKAKRGKRR